MTKWLLTYIVLYFATLVLTEYITHHHFSLSRNVRVTIIRSFLQILAKQYNYLKNLLNAHTLINAHPPIWMPQMAFYLRVLEFQEPLINAHFETVGKNPIFKQ